MSKFSRLLIMFLLLTILQSSMTKNSNRISWEEDTSDDESGERAVHERPLDDFSQLRHFLLTANAEQRAARREEQEFHKRELVNPFDDFKRISFRSFLDSRISSISI